MVGSSLISRIILALALPVLAVSQVKATFSPALAYKLPGKAVVWNVTVCVANSSAPGVNVRGGDLLAMMTARGVTWLTQSQAVAVLQAAPSKSIVAELAKWGGYLSAGAAFLLTTEVVKASTAKTAAVTTASGALNVIVPLATKAVPPVPTDVQSGLLGPFLVIPAGACSAAIVIGGVGAAFEGML